MKLKTGTLVLVVIALLIGLFTLSRKSPQPVFHSENGPHGKNGESADLPKGTNPSGSGSLLSLREIVSAPIRGENQPARNLSEACARLEDSLFRLSLDDLEFPPKVTLPNPTGCSPPNAKLAKMLRHYSNACAAAFIPVDDTSPRKKSTAASFTPCQMATIMLRSTLATSVRGERPLSEITDSRELADLLISNFGQLFTEDLSGSVSVASITAVADRMLELNPRLFAAMKAGALGQMLDFSLRKEALEKGMVPEGTTVEKPDWAELEKRVAQIAESNPNDPDLPTLRRLAETEGMTPDLVRKVALERLAKNPRDAAEFQMLAWSYFRSGRRQEAKAELDRAIAIDPRNREYRMNRAIVISPKTLPEDFKIVMKVGFGFSDLLK